MGILTQQNDLWFPFECNGQTYFLPKSCPHRGGRLDLGHLNPQKGLVVCPLHKSTFCIPDGKRLSGPTCDDLQVLTTCPPQPQDSLGVRPPAPLPLRGVRP